MLAINMNIKNQYKRIFGHEIIERRSCKTIDTGQIQMILDVKIISRTSSRGNYN